MVVIRLGLVGGGGWEVGGELNTLRAVGGIRT